MRHIVLRFAKNKILQSTALRLSSKGLLRIALPLVDQAIISALTFISTVLLVHVTSLGVFGEIAYKMMIGLIGQNLVFSFIILPMNTIAISYENETKSFLTAILALVLFSSCVFACFFALAFYATGRYENTLEIITFCLSFVLTGLQEAGRRQLYLSPASFVSVLVTITRHTIPFLALFVFLEKGLTLAPYQYWGLLAVSSALALIVQLIFCKTTNTNPAMIKRVAKSCYFHGSWLFYQAVLEVIAGNLFFLTAGWLLTSVELGIWRSMQTVSGFLNPILIALENIVPSRASRYYRGAGAAQGDLWLLRAFLACGIPYLLLALIVAVFARPLASLLFPSIPMGWEWITQSYCITQSLLVCRFFITLYARIHGFSRSIMKAAAWIFLVALALAYPVPKFLGIYGAVWGITVTQIVIIVVTIAFLRVERRARTGLAPAKLV